MCVKIVSIVIKKKKKLISSSLYPYLYLIIQVIWITGPEKDGKEKIALLNLSETNFYFLLKIVFLISRIIESN